VGGFGGHHHGDDGEFVVAVRAALNAVRYGNAVRHGNGVGLRCNAVRNGVGRGNAVRNGVEELRSVVAAVPVRDPASW